jgi:hypothetical protein
LGLFRLGCLEGVCVWRVCVLFRGCAACGGGVAVLCVRGLFFSCFGVGSLFVGRCLFGVPFVGGG